MRAAVTTGSLLLGLVIILTFLGDGPQADAQVPPMAAESGVADPRTAVAPRGQLPAAPQSQAAAGGGMIALSTLQGTVQVMTVIDTQTRSLAVYHVNLSDGKISLKSTRQIDWDLQLSEFNSDHPLPGEIRSMLGKQ